MYDRIVAAALGTPWAILPAKGAVIEDIIARLARGNRMTREEIDAAAGQKRPKAKGRPAAGVGLIQVFGTITQRADWLSEWSGGASAEEIGKAVDAMAADPGTEAIVMEFDSPGGSVYGIEQLALKVQAAAKEKKVIAVVNSLAASAAYWVASNASEVVVAPDGEVGSIGVYLMHRDVSRAVDAAGQKVTFVKAGKNKTAGNSYEPLTADALAELQKGVDDYYDLFVRAVARGRGASQSRVREGFGQGGTVRAKEAVAEGMADRIGTLDDVLGRWGLSAADVQPVQAALQPDRFAVENRRRRLALG